LEPDQNYAVSSVGRCFPDFPARHHQTV